MNKKISSDTHINSQQDGDDDCKTLDINSYWIRAACYSPDGKYIAACTSDECIKIWNSQTFEEIHTIESSGSAGKCAIRFNSKITLLAMGGPSKMINLYKVPGFQKVSSLKGHS